MPMTSVPSDDDQAALRFAAAHPDAALCTIVGIDGSFSRRLGAQLAIGADGTMAGSLADGCLEHELIRQADAARAEGAPRLLRYGAGSPVIDFRLPCGSGLDLMIDPAPGRAALAAAIAALDARHETALPLPRLALPAPRADLLAERRFMPAPRLIVLGTGPEAAALAGLAASHGLEVVAAGPDGGPDSGPDSGPDDGPGARLALGRRPATLTADRWTAIVLLFHDHEWETTLLDWALDTPAFYIGAQGGATARANRRETLMRIGREAAAIDRVRSPIGLIPHAREARTLALSVLAEVVAVYEGLRD